MSNAIERLVDDIERSLEKKHEREVASKEIGELVMKGFTVSTR